MGKFISFNRAFIVSLALVLLLVGCSSKEESGSADQEQEEEIYQIKMAYMDPSSSTDQGVQQVQGAINEIVKEKINATVELVPISAAQYQQQQNLMLSGSEKLDLIFTSSMYGYSTQANNGQLLPLGDLLDEYGQDIKEEIPEKILSGAKIQGKVYGIPSVRNWAVQIGFSMREDIVEKYGIDLNEVNDWGDLTNIFEIVKENEPDLTPVAASTTIPLGSRMYESKFDELSGGIAVSTEGDSGSVINMFENSVYKETINLIREWNEAGFISTDAATSSATAAELVAANKAFGFVDTWSPGNEITKSALTGYSMVHVKISPVFINSTAATQLNMSIAKNSKNPEKAMEFLNLLYSDEEIMNLLAHGIEGEHYSKNEDGTIKPLENSNYSFNQWELGNNFLTYALEGYPPDLREKEKAFNESADYSPVFGFSFNPEAVKSEIAATSNVLDQYRLGLEQGVLDPEEALPKINNALKDAGIDNIMTEMQKQLDEWKEKQ